MAQQGQVNQGENQAQKGPQAASQTGFKSEVGGMKSDEQRTIAAEGAADEQDSDVDSDSDLDVEEGIKSQQSDKASEKKLGTASVDRKDQSRTNQ